MDYEGTIANNRERLLNWVRTALIGPGDEASDITEDFRLKGIQPVDRYHTAILFPIIPGESGIDPASEEADDDMVLSSGEVTSEDAENEPAYKTHRYVPPSSVGFSFYVTGQTISIQVRPWGVRYVRSDDGRTQEWSRIPLGSQDEESLNLKAPPTAEVQEESFSVFNGKGEIHIVWRPHAEGWLTTIAFCNKQELTETSTPQDFVQARNLSSIFEAKLSCIIDSGDVGAYPRVDRSLLSEEEKELELQYHERRIYAIGHGAAVDWTEDDGKILELKANFLPAVEVPQVTADVVKNSTGVLDISLLAEFPGTKNELPKLLEQFVDEYTNWIVKQQKDTEGLDKDEAETARRITARMTSAVKRMKFGIQILTTDPAAAQGFRLANLAMLNQMAKYDQCLGKAPRPYRWRPFQLAFILLSIESVINEDSNDRDLVDLIWFPTGGGKTEAYLGLIAFLIVWRRIRFPATSQGTSVLMRYTLRLLTAQQFERATRVICALELIRRDNPSLLGNEPITIGMWVGAASTPNTFHNAAEVIKKATRASDDPPLSLVFGNCPWCHMPFKASENFYATESKFHIRCTNSECDFGQTELGIIPCNVVDEALFEAPPTMLIATVDKFARLAWDERTAAFFGRWKNRPPELIIQDELHLISGALGSIAGLYEAALDTVLIQHGVRPKYIASTATIRMADQQVRRLYGRDVAVFPPPGLSCNDSFFARTILTSDRPGRLYVGYLAPMKNRQACMAPLAAALLAAPEILFPEGYVDREIFLDAWWTQVVYHGSLRGVGNSHNSFVIDVPFYYRWFKEKSNQGAEENSGKPEISRLRSQLAQLTSLSTPDENKRTFERLEYHQNEDKNLDAVLATNMISVGLDVSRLALMIVNGQPLTTAEYIQASSRVGRGEVPGLVFVNYYRDQARSLSHYENFRPYHESFYRFVEPTSITPYTYQARMRALHAALTIVIRHSCKHLLKNDSAGRFDPSDQTVAAAICSLSQRCSMADPERTSEIKKHIELLAEEWKSFSDRCRDRRQFHYTARDTDKTAERLLYNHEDRIKGVWPTLQSMRNVEASALIKLL